MIKLKSIRKQVASTGTPEALSATSIKPGGLVIQAPTSNTNTIFIGNDTEQWFGLEPGELVDIVEVMHTFPFERFDMSEIYIRVSINGESAVALYSDYT